MSVTLGCNDCQGFRFCKGNDRNHRLHQGYWNLAPRPIVNLRCKRHTYCTKVDEK